MSLWNFFRRKPALSLVPTSADDWDYEELARRKLTAGSTLKDIPISNVTDWDSVSKVKSALTQMETGQFGQVAMLIDAFGRDDRITGLMQQRIKGLLGKPLNFEPAGDARRAGTVRDWFADESFCEIAPEEVQVALLKWGILLGVAVAELVWERGDKWIPHLRVWHPRHLYWRWDTRSYWLSTMEGPVEVTPGDGRWFLYTPNGTQRGWMGGMVRALAIPFLIRQFTYRDWARYSEIHGIPIRGGVVPPEATTEEKKRFIRELAALSTESVILLPQLSNENGFNVKLIEAVALGWEAFDKLIEKTEDSMAIALLGQTLTSGAKSGGLGTGGVAKVHQDVRSDLMLHDSKTFGEALRDQVLAPATDYNFGDEDLAPLPNWEVEPKDDLQEKSLTLLQLGQAVTALKGAGVPVDSEELAEEFQIPMLTPEEAAAQEAADVARAANRVKAMAEAAPKPSPAGGPAKSDPPSPDKPTPAGDSKLETKPDGLVAGQLYADRIADHARDKGAKAIHPNLQTILTIVRDAHDYETLRARLLEAYKGMSPDALAEVMRKAMILAELNGRDAVLEDV